MLRLKNLASIILALVMAVTLLPGASITALAAEGDFTVSNGTLTKYNGSGGEVTIPNGVTTIGAGAFELCETLTAVTIPDGVTTIGDNAFKYCRSLTSINIPNSVTTIGEGALYNCEKLTSVVIPDSVKIIKDLTFFHCEKLTSFTIPETVTEIGKYAFRGCRALTAITIPASVTKIGEFAFDICEKLNTVTFAGTPTSIDQYAFREVPAKFTITYDSQGGSAVAAHQVVPAGKDSKPSNPTRTDYVFGGWYKEADCVNAWNFSSDFVLRDITLYANWSVKPSLAAPAGTVVIDALTGNGEFINLTTETIDLGGFTVAAYSTDGGKKWTKGALPTGDKFSKLFDKELTLWVVDGWNDKDIKEDGEIVERKGVPDGAVFVEFPTIKARPKANDEKLAAYYANNTWTLMTKPTKTAAATAPTAVYEYVKGNTSDGKMPSDTSWQRVPDEGFSILSKPEKSDKSKNVYYFRSAPSASGGVYTPGSKSFKISPAYYGAAYKYKIDYKKEELKLKKGDRYSVDGGTSWTDVTEAKPEPLNVSSYITSGASIKVIKAATGSKPRTSIQTITPVSRATLTDKAFTCAKGKITDTVELKKYEILDTSKNPPKWGNLPKVTESAEFDIRLKADAKLTKDTWTGSAASSTGKLVITYGVYDDSGKTPKSGIIAAEVKIGGGDTPISPETFKVTLRYNANAAVVIDILVSNAANPYTLPAFPESKWTAPEGKVFKGWSLSATGAVITTSTIELTGNTDLYAIWGDGGADAGKVAAIKAALTREALKPEAPESAEYDIAGARAAISAKATALLKASGAGAGSSLSLGFKDSTFIPASGGTNGSIAVIITIEVNDAKDKTAELTVVIPAYSEYSSTTLSLTKTDSSPVLTASGSLYSANDKSTKVANGDIKSYFTVAGVTLSKATYADAGKTITFSLSGVDAYDTLALNTQALYGADGKEIAPLQLIYVKEFVGGYWKADDGVPFYTDGTLSYISSSGPTNLVLKSSVRPYVNGSSVTSSSQDVKECFLATGNASITSASIVDSNGYIFTLVIENASDGDTITITNSLTDTNSLRYKPITLRYSGGDGKWIKAE